jgi:hypothetical protein
MDRLARLLFVVGIAGIAFSYGYLARGWKLFPYQTLKEAGDAAGAIAKYYLEEDYLVGATDTDAAGVVISDRASMAPGPTFLSLYDGERFLGRVVDAEGRTLHEWRMSLREAFGVEPEHLRYLGSDDKIQWHGTHLFPNGDLLLNFEGHMFPYGGGLVRLDKDSRIVWKLARNTHHDIELDKDGYFWVAAMHYRDRPMPELPHLEPWYYEDVVLKVAPNGQVVDEISVPLALEALPALSARDDRYDPTHLNDVDVISADQASRLPMFKAGDLLLSLRNLNAVVAVDPRTKKAYWSLVGSFVRQHDPDLTPWGTMLLFDNRGGDPSCGGSELVELDLVTQQPVWRFDGCMGTSFRSIDWGNEQLLPNGNVLIAESRAGRVLEVTREAAPRVVWEYVNFIGTLDGKPHRGLIGDAQRYAPGELTFLEPGTPDVAKLAVRP